MSLFLVAFLATGCKSSTTVSMVEFSSATNGTTVGEDANAPLK